MQVKFLKLAKRDFDFLLKSGDKANLKKINELIKAICENPYEGIGKPELLKHDLSGKWSRRINHTDRLIYQVENDTVFVYSLKGHYEK